MAQRPDRGSVKVSEPAWPGYPLTRLDLMIAVVSAIVINVSIRFYYGNTKREDRSYLMTIAMGGG